MKPIARRTFLRRAGQATALASVGRASAASGRILLISDPADALIASPAVQWAASELRSAIESKGLECAAVRSASEAGDFQLAVTIARERTPLAAEAFHLAPAALQGRPGLRVSASDARGYVYAITELADRVRHGADPIAALALNTPLEDKPANKVRSIARAFVDDVEDKPWFYDRAFWRDYLTALV